MTGLYTLDSAALHARLGLLAALAGARKNLMLLPSGGGSGTALQRLQLVGEIARVRKELGGAADGRSQEQISADEASRLFAELRRMNADPEWSSGDGHRYEFVAKRIDAASEGRPDAVKWAREWLSELDSRVEEVQQQEVAAQSERDAANARYTAEVAAGRSGNPLFQAWLDTLEDPASAKNYQYIIWNSRRGAEFDKLWSGGKRGLNGNVSTEYSQAREAYFRRWADEHLAERVKAQKGAQAEEAPTAAESDDPRPADASAPAAAEAIVEHTTAKGKVLRGVVRAGLTLAEAQKIDKYTFRKDGGYFIREKYLQQPEAAEQAPPDAEAARAELDALTAEAQRRMAEAAESAGVGIALSGAEIDYLTAEEKARRHELLGQLRVPDSAEQAAERVQERIKARREAAADLPQAKRRNRPLEYTGYSGQARSVRSYYEAGGYRIAKPHEGLFEVIDKDGQAIHQMAGLGGALSVVQRLMAGAVLDDASEGDLLLDAAGGTDHQALLGELDRAMEALSAADDPAVRLDLLAEVARLRKALSATDEAAPAADDADAFIEAPGGGLDFGEITAEMAQAAGRQPGRIRLQAGNASWGMMHIEQRHGAEIRSAGFPDVQAFVADVARHIDQVWKPATTRQLVVLHKTSSNLMMFVELQPGRDDAGDFYTVNTAFASRKAEKKGWKLLWEARAQASGDSGNRPPFAEPPQ